MSLIKLKQPVILNAKGEPFKLSPKEQYHADYTQRLVNERFQNVLGYEISITTLTTIMKKISEQKFFEVAPADYLPLQVGEGAWSSNLTTYRSFDVADDFETGVVNTGSGNARLASADAGVDSLNILVQNWAKSIGWTIMDLEMAAKSGNWDIVTSKEKARKKNWDLGIQKIAFLGSKDGVSKGLLNQTGVTNDLATITAPISSLTPAALSTFCQVVIEKYRSNCARTTFPTHFIVPESDYNGMAAQASPTFPMKSILQLLEEMFQTVTRNKSFKILPLAYGDNAYSQLGVQRYALLNYDEESLRMNVPVDYTNTLANSIDNFGFQNVGYGQFTGVLVLRPLELYYFSY